jgi:L-fuconate dehydratase
MACGAIMNAVWDLWARKEGKPLWELVVDMEPEQLVRLIDFKHMSDVLTPDRALLLLQAKRPGWQQRKKEMAEKGYPAYTTSAGWLGYPEDKVRALCR